MFQTWYIKSIFCQDDKYLKLKGVIMGFKSFGVLVIGKIKAVFDLLFQFSLLNPPSGADDVELIYDSGGDGSTSGNGQRFRYNSIDRTLSGFVRPKNPYERYYWVFRIWNRTTNEYKDYTITTDSTESIVDPVVDAPKPTSPVNEVNATEPTPAYEQVSLEYPPVGTDAYKELGGIQPSQTPKEYFDMAAPGPDTVIPPPKGWSAEPAVGTAPTNYDPANPPPAPPNPDPAPIPRAIHIVQREVSPGVWIDVYPPDWVDPNEGRLSQNRNGTVVYYAMSGDSVSWIFEVDPEFTTGSGLYQGTVTNIAMTEGRLPPGFQFEYPYNSNPLQARIYGTMPYLNWPEEFMFILTATNEYGAYHDRVFSIYAEPDRGYVIVNSPVDDGQGGRTNNLTINVGPNVTKIYVEIWGGGGGGHAIGHVGGGSSLSRSLITAAEGDEFYIVLGEGGTAVPENAEQAENGQSTFFYRITRDTNPESPTFGNIISQTLIVGATGGGGALHEADGGHPTTNNLGQDVRLGSSYEPGGADGDHIGSIGNGYGGAPVTNGGYGRLYVEYGPHINSASSVNDLAY
jgi:hypothetical protein